MSEHGLTDDEAAVLGWFDRSGSLAPVFDLPPVTDSESGPLKVTSIRLPEPLLALAEGYAAAHPQEFPDGRSGLIRTALVQYLAGRAGGVAQDETERALAILARFVREHRDAA